MFINPTIGATAAKPPYYLIAYEADAVPSITPLGDNLTNMKWTAAQTLSASSRTLTRSNVTDYQLLDMIFRLESSHQHSRQCREFRRYSTRGLHRRRGLLELHAQRQTDLKCQAIDRGPRRTEDMYCTTAADRGWLEAVYSDARCGGFRRAYQLYPRRQR